MFYHGSPSENLDVLKPNISEHNEPLVYLSKNITHATLYTVKSNFYPYGFDQETEAIVYTEYYPDNLYDIYSGKSGYIYKYNSEENLKPFPGIKYAYISKEELKIDSVEFIDDIYRKLIHFEEQGKLIINRYDSLSAKRKGFIHNQIITEIKKNNLLSEKNDYSTFIKKKFPEAWKDAE